ncbi:MAG: methyltransferase domain-containing protein [Verrucomicrobia bacterium]|nr:methyltransferase domain-containing protein [Verrucomicrobiota bacterium]
MNVETGSFPERRLRSEYIAARFRPLLKGKVLDVGCDRALLKQLVPGLDYFGIDIGGTPDRVVDLEKENAVPFPDNSYDCIVCSDVLEHLNNIHHIFAELIRVTRGHVVLSLPNNWTNARRPVARGKGAIGHYGLPVNPPEDRHKWFFSLTEAEAFIKGQQAKVPFEIVEMFAMVKPRFGPLKMLRQLTAGSQGQYLNRYAHTLWAVLKKK